MNDGIRDLLIRLTEPIGPSGFESAAAAAWRRMAEPIADEVTWDLAGNSYAWLRTGDDAPTVVIEAHIDEIGLQITHIDDAGYLWIGEVGGWDAQVLVGQRIRFQGNDGQVIGVIGRKARHLLEPSDREKATETKALWVDIGASGRDDASRLVTVGDYGVIDAPFIDLQNGLVAGRAIDNRSSAVVILEALRLLAENRPTVNVVALAAAREEISFAGAYAAAHQLAPLAAIAVDVTHSTDYPEADKRRDAEVRLGGGPVITRGSSTSAPLTGLLIQTARKNGMSYALQASPSKTYTDADAMIEAGSGSATAVVSIPTRYMHSPNETISLSDVAACAELIAASVREITRETELRP